MLPHVHVRLTCEKKTWHAARNVPGLSPDMVKKTTAHLRGKHWEGGCNQVAAMKRGSKANTQYFKNISHCHYMSNPNLRIVGTLQRGDGAGNKVCIVATSAQL